MSPRDPLSLPAASYAAERVASLIATAADLALVLDRAGVVQQVSVCEPELLPLPFGELTARPWSQTVTGECRGKVEALLQEAEGGRSWREINQLVGDHVVPMRFTAVMLGPHQVLALGQDLRTQAALQQQVLQTQQAHERDYRRLRQAEARNRLQFASAEPALIIDAASGRIVEANPAAATLLNAAQESLAGQEFGRLFAGADQMTARAFLAERAGEAGVLLQRNGPGGPLRVASAAFREAGRLRILVHLSGQGRHPPGAPQALLGAAAQHLPDPMLITSEDLRILEANTAFAERVQLVAPAAARGAALSQFIGQSGIDLSVLLANLRAHGWLRNFTTVVRSRDGAQEDVLLSAASFREGRETFYSFILHGALREQTPQSTAPQDLPHSAEQLMQLVGRVSLRQIVGETADAIERMCIESALRLTSNNRASAAEILGLSRQSLYSKLNRYGLVRGAEDGGEEV